MKFTELSDVLEVEFTPADIKNLAEYGYSPVEDLYGLEVNTKQLAAAIEYVQNWRGVTVVLPVESDIDLLDTSDYSCDLDCHIEVRQGHIWENVVEVNFYAVDKLTEVKFEVHIAKFSVPIISAKCYIKALTEESILEFPLEISSNLHEDIFGAQNA